MKINELSLYYTVDFIIYMELFRYLFTLIYGVSDHEPVDRYLINEYLSHACENVVHLSGALIT